MRTLSRRGEGLLAAKQARDDAIEPGEPPAAGEEDDGELSVPLIGDIQTDVADVRGLVHAVRDASQQQAHGAQQVLQAVVQLEKVTQSTAANAEESAAASEELSAQAETAKLGVRTLIEIVNGRRRAAPEPVAGRRPGHGS